MIMNLERLQRAMQDHVLHGDAAIVPQINATGQDSAGQDSGAIRLAIYADAYRLRLIDALAHNYPRLQQLLGVETFAGLAQRYIDKHPSTSVSVRWFGHRLGDALSDDDLGESRGQPRLAELARWEWAIAAAFDARDASPLTEAALTEVEPAAWPTLRFRFHPSLQRLQLHTNAPAAFKALSDETDCPAPATLESPQAWLIWRQDLTTRYRSLTRKEAKTLDTLRNDGTFEQVCEVLCEWHEPGEVPVQAAMFLKGWIGEGLVVGAGAADLRVGTGLNLQDLRER